MGRRSCTSSLRVRSWIVRVRAWCRNGYRCYARAGVRELWLVSTDRLAARTFRNDDGRFVEAERFGPDDRLESPHLPGFAVRVGDLLQ